MKNKKQFVGHLFFTNEYGTIGIILYEQLFDVYCKFLFGFTIVIVRRASYLNRTVIACALVSTLNTVRIVFGSQFDSFVFQLINSCQSLKKKLELKLQPKHTKFAL